MCRFLLFFAISFAFAQVDILVNVVGYEKSGAKRAVIQSSSAISATEAELVNSGGTVVHTISLKAQTNVKGWSGRVFKVADFSDFEQNGEYRLKVGSAQSPLFSIGEKILQAKTGASQVSFFKGMRNTDEGDRNLAIRGGGTHNIYGGWWDATGDPGKHLSHLSYANYFNPQQIPLVVWALLHANEFQPNVFGTAAKEEAAWGADYLLRSLSAQGYFYMSVFDNWGGWGEGTRQICAWSGQDGTRSTDYQSAMREGGGVSIAALARASKAGISGDSSSAQYLAAAKRAYAHLKANPTAYQDNKKENIIDDYTGLLAAT
ncbi:MAG: glycoside hydrolase family 9 protein, partial [Fibromonadales bacterium]|nr:glycoside hydrolase family 9 protein [Fibromonadales bacterium]